VVWIDQWECRMHAAFNGRVHAKSPAQGKIADSWMFFNFVRPELPFNHREGLMGCRNYVALWIWCFYGDSLRCVVIRERFVGLGRLQSPAFLRFKWRNNTANKRTKNSPKMATNCTQITNKIRQPHVKVSEFYFHIHDFILAFWEPTWISHTKAYSEGPISKLDPILILSLGCLWSVFARATLKLHNTQISLATFIEMSRTQFWLYK